MNPVARPCVSILDVGVRLSDRGGIAGREPKFSGGVVVREMIRNMELGQFEMAYTTLLPCIFTVYLNPQDHANLSGIFDLIAEDARRALRAHVAELNAERSRWGVARTAKPRKEFKIACRDWAIEFFPHDEVPVGDVEIHSELNEAPQAGFRGARTTLLDRDPIDSERSKTSEVSPPKSTQLAPESVYAEIVYRDDSGDQTFLVTDNRVRVGRGGNGQGTDVALYANDEVSREHLLIRRDAATGIFLVTDLSKNGTWVGGKRLKKGIEEVLPDESDIGVGQVITLKFRARR